MCDFFFVLYFILIVGNTIRPALFKWSNWNFAECSNFNCNLSKIDLGMQPCHLCGLLRHFARNITEIIFFAKMGIKTDLREIIKWIHSVQFIPSCYAMKQCSER